MDALKNFAISLVATAPSPATSGTSLVVTAGQGSYFPACLVGSEMCIRDRVTVEPAEIAPESPDVVPPPRYVPDVEAVNRPK